MGWDIACHAQPQRPEKGMIHPDRERANLDIFKPSREISLKSAQPTISVDTKKKEVLGNLKNPGQKPASHEIPT